METKLFIITKKTKKEEKPVHAFFEESYEKAKLYFQGFCWGENGDFRLRWIGKFENQKLITCNVFIMGSFEANSKTENDHKAIKQLKMRYEYALNNNKPFMKVIEKIFEGEEINE